MRASIHDAIGATTGRRFYAAGRLLLLCLAIAFPGRHEAAAQNPSILAGRLGGTLASFQAAYGEPAGVNAATGVEFAVAGFGLVAVQFDRTVAKAEPDDPALVITVSAPRPVDVPAETPQEGDWSTAEAIDRARSFLPADARLGELRAAESRVHADCESDALQATFGVLSLGRCSVQFITPTPTTVSWAVLSLTEGAPELASGATPTADPCAGLVIWSETAASRLGDAERLLRGASTVDGNDPEAPAALRETATAVAGLADAQRSAEAPAAAAKANYFLIAAFSAYADAVETAAAALTTADDALVDEAVAGIADADRAVARATAEITATAEECGMETGPPATPSARRR